MKLGFTQKEQRMANNSLSMIVYNIGYLLLKELNECLLQN